MATPRTPAPKQADPKADQEKRIAGAHAKALKRAADNFTNAAIEWDKALPGTIGKQQAAVRAKACRKALDDTVATLVKRERLDAHSASFRRAVGHIETYAKHEQLPATDARVLERAVRTINGALKQMQSSVEAQRNAIDEEVLTQSNRHTNENATKPGA